MSSGIGTVKYHLRFMYFSEDDNIIDDSSTDSEEERRRKRKEKKRKMEKNHEKKFSEFHFTSSSLHTWPLDEMLIRVISYPIQLNKLLTSPFCLFPKVTKRKKTRVILHSVNSLTLSNNSHRRNISP